MRVKTPNIILTLLFGTLLGCGQNSNVSENPPENEPVFSELSENEAQNFAQTIETEGISLKSRYVKVNLPVLKKQAAKIHVGESAATFIKLNLNLFNDETITVLLDKVEKVSEKNIIFSGQVAGDLESGVSIVVNDNVMVANIRKSDADQVYEVRLGSGDVHIVNLRQDEPEEACPAITAPEDEGVAEDHAQSISEDTAQATIYRVDILGAYTPNARIKAGGTSAMIALLQLGVADTNTAATNSSAYFQVRLVGTLELNRNETGNWSNDLGYLKGKTDGRWDEVHSKRSSVGADQVTVVATYPYQSGTNGIGYVRSSYSSAFTIVRNSSFGAYTFAHELGHNFGLNHSDGYVNYSGRFRTVMAYGSYPRIRRFSNPYRTYNGYRTGDSDQYSVKILNSRAYSMSVLTASKI